MTKNYIAIRNKGEVPIELVELLGASTKADDPKTIGMFGSGIKYAIIEALRLGIGINISTSKWILSFEFEDEKVSGHLFQRVIFVFKPREGKRRKIRTSYTLSAGKNWKEPWYILREFIANAMDVEVETGEKFELDITDSVDFSKRGTTTVFIQYTDQIAEVVENMGQYMKTSEMIPIHSNSYGSIYEKVGAGTKIFHKGMRVHEDKKESVYDYSLNRIAITEDRTIANSWELSYQMAKLLSYAPNEIKMTIVKRIFENRDDFFENSIDFDYAENHSEWAEAFQEAQPRGVLSPDHGDVIKEIEYQDRIPMVSKFNVSMDRMLKATNKIDTADKLFGKGIERYKLVNASNVKRRIMDNLRRAKKLLKPYFGEYNKTVKVKLFRLREGESYISGTFIDSNTVGINVECLSNGVATAAEALLREYIEIKVVGSKSSKTFHEELVSLAVKLMIEK